MNETLQKTGISFWKEEDFSPETVILRDGREATLWVERETGHGILDRNFWEKEDFYEEDYRKEFTANLGEEVENLNNLSIYAHINEKQFQTFFDLIDRNTRYLELGASFGGVFGKAEKYVKEAWAVEPNRKDAAFLHSRFPESHILNKPLEQAELPESYFSIATAFEVLEHTATPCTFLKKCFDALEPGGRIHLEVPNRNDLLYSTYQIPRYQTFFHHKAHIHYYTAASLKKVLQENGFTGEVTSFLMYPFFNHVFWTQNNAPQGAGEKALNLHVPVDRNTEQGKRIFDFWKQCERNYEQMINSMMLGDCLIFSGVKESVCK